ncbi:hypothetical protein AAG747_10715 [Rapidithrix thailandica]|uniref:Uncharacterized protein n=1 Tax=Rapidithrix thailandica TaxID=413964 RepID=A0AAW9RU03_9BACT
MTEDGIKIGSSRHFLKKIANAIVAKSKTEEAFLKHFSGKRKSLIHFNHRNIQISMANGYFSMLSHFPEVFLGA